MVVAERIAVLVGELCPGCGIFGFIQKGRIRVNPPYRKVMTLLTFRADSQRRTWADKERNTT